MRKLDAVLLSALILYDYSAQSLVDSDILSMSNSFIMERVGLQEADFPEDKLADPLPLPAINENVITQENTELNPYTSTKEKNISYHALAKINSAATTVATESQYNDVNAAVRISTTGPFDAAIALSESPSLVRAEETNLSLSVTSVSSSFVELSSSKNIEVKAQFNEGNMQFADTDNDGMFNFEDKCPGVAGVARFEGCLVPDADADGVNDEEDRCPFVKGSDLNGGCAETESIVTNLGTNNLSNDHADAAEYLTVVKFNETDVLSNKDFNIILQLADKIINNPGAKVDVFKSNDKGSAIQANIVVSYLRDLGVKDSQLNISTMDAVLNAMSAVVQIKIRY